MFNLEQSILEWRGRMVSAGVKNPQILDELESHVREEWARRVELGESEESAFQGAVAGVGEASLLRHEFAKVSGKKWAWVSKFKALLGGGFEPVPAMGTLTPSARRALELARVEAPRLHHGFVGTEHVLLGVLGLEEGVVPDVLKTLGVDRDAVRRKVENCVSVFSTAETPEELRYTPRVEKSLRLAAREAKVAANGAVGAEHILLGLMLEGDGVAGRVLRDCGLNPEKTREEIMKETGGNRGGD